MKYLLITSIVLILIKTTQYQLGKNNMEKQTPTVLTPEQILNVIREEGFFPHTEDDGDVSFKINGTTFTYGTCARGFVYGRLYFNLNGVDKWKALLAAQHVDLSYVAIKTLVVPENDSLIFSVESLCGSSETFKLFFNRSIYILSDSVKTFSQKIHELEDDPECEDVGIDESLSMCENFNNKTLLS